MTRLSERTAELQRKSELDVSWTVLNFKDAFTDRKLKRFIRGVVVSSQKPNAHGNAYYAKGCRVTLPLPLLWNHETARPIGKVYALEVHDYELRFSAEIMNGGDIWWVEQVWEAIASRSARGVSMFAKNRNPASDVQPLTNWTMDEISVVETPADPHARIQRAWHKDAHIYLDGRRTTFEIWGEK